MTQFQMLMLGLGAVIVASAFWDQILGFVKKITTKKDTTPNESNPTGKKKDPCECNDLCVTDLTEIVGLWETLKSQCEEHKLQDAAIELEKIFPLLVKVQKSAPATPKAEGTV